MFVLWTTSVWHNENDGRNEWLGFGCVVSAVTMTMTMTNVMDWVVRCCVVHCCIVLFCVVGYKEKETGGQTPSFVLRQNGP